MGERFTKRHAVILAEMLSDGAYAFLQHFRDHKNFQGPETVWREIEELGLVEARENLLDHSTIWVLTAKGKKVAAVLA